MSSSTTGPRGCCSRLKSRRKRKGRRRLIRRGDLQRDHLVILEDDCSGISRVNLWTAPIVHVDDELLVGRERELRHVGGVQTHPGIALLLVPGRPDIKELAQVEG